MLDRARRGGFANSFGVSVGSLSPARSYLCWRDFLWEGEGEGEGKGGKSSEKRDLGGGQWICNSSGGSSNYVL